MSTAFAPVDGDPERLRAVARALRDVAADLAQRSGEVDGAVERATTTWTGRRALDLRLVACGVAHAARASLTAVGELAVAVGDLAGALELAQEEVGQESARAARAHEEAEHRVSALPPGDPRVEGEREHARGVRRGAEAAADDARSAYDVRARGVAARIEALADAAAGAVATADPAGLAALAGRRVPTGSAVAAAWGSLGGWLDPAPDGPDVLPTVAALASPVAAYAWWRSLSPVQQQAVLRRHPASIGNLDGIPATVRDLANRERIGPVRAAVSRRLRAALDRPAVDLGDLSRPPWRVHRDRERLGEQLRALTALGVVLARPGRRLLTLDLDTGRRVHAAVAVGDVDEADNVAVFTPGLTTTVEDSAVDYDQEVADLRDTAERVAPGSAARTATVAWLGYDAPQLDEVLAGDRSVGASHLARQGAVGLAGFLGGIEASRPQGVHLVAVGHSYGSTTTGYALARVRSGVDDVALLGSPGSGVAHAADLHVPRGHRYVESAPRDPVARIIAFGTSPRVNGGFVALDVGAHTVRGAHLAAVSGHTHYLDPGTTSLANLAAVVAGRPEEAVRAPAAPEAALWK